jgi:hypothetical protein
LPIATGTEGGATNAVAKMGRLYTALITIGWSGADATTTDLTLSATLLLATQHAGRTAAGSVRSTATDMGSAANVIADNHAGRAAEVIMKALILSTATCEGVTARDWATAAVRQIAARDALAVSNIVSDHIGSKSRWIKGGYYRFDGRDETAETCCRKGRSRAIVQATVTVRASVSAARRVPPVARVVWAVSSRFQA